MTEIASIVKSLAEKSGFVAFDDFEDVDTLEYPLKYLAFAAVKKYVISSWVRSYDYQIYGAEITGRVCIRLFGKRGNFSDRETLSKRVSSLIKKLGFCSQFVMTSIECGELVENRLLGRLEQDIIVDFRTMITAAGLTGEV